MTADTPPTFAPRLDILPPAQRRLWDQLRPAAALGWVLYGGTAIALRLGHRVSVDFDFFSERQLDRRQLQANFGFLSRAITLQDAPDTWSLTVPDDDDDGPPVQVSFFGAIDFGRAGVPQHTDDGVLQVASARDLLATKLKVLLQRVEAKDYRDIAALLGAGADLPTGLACARALFGSAFQPSESLKALVYFEGGDLHTLAQDERTALVQAARDTRDLPSAHILSQQLAVA